VISAQNRSLFRLFRRTNRAQSLHVDAMLTRGFAGGKLSFATRARWLYCGPARFAAPRLRTPLGDPACLCSVRSFASYLSCSSSRSAAPLRSKLAQSTRVELVVDEATPGRTVAWPVTTGVPFPRGALTDDDHCTLVDDTGAERPLQTKVAATWDAERKSIRWLTIDFIAQPGRKYALLFGPDVLRERFFPTLTVAYAGDTRAANHAVVSTGAIQVDFAPRAPEALHAVRLDVNGDGTIAHDERVAGGQKEGDHTFTEASGRISSSARDAKDRTIHRRSHRTGSGLHPGRRLVHRSRRPADGCLSNALSPLRGPLADEGDRRVPDHRVDARRAIQRHRAAAGA